MKPTRSRLVRSSPRPTSTTQPSTACAPGARRSRERINKAPAAATAPIFRIIRFIMAQYVYTMRRVSKTVPPKRTILKNISLNFFPGAKIGVLGLNGSGKSSLLRIMAGADDNHEGEVIRMPGIRVGYLAPEPALPKEIARAACG